MVDASKVNSAECFREWSAHRSKDVNDAAKAFRRSLSAHITGSDGRRPFTPEEEQAVLSVVRCKRQWPAFEDSNVTIGLKGFQSYGFHEKRRNKEPHNVKINEVLQQHAVADVRPVKTMRMDPTASSLAPLGLNTAQSQMMHWPMHGIPPFFYANAYAKPVYYVARPYPHLR